MTAAPIILEPGELLADAKAKMIWLAIERARLGGRGSSKPAAGLLPDDVLLEAAMRFLTRGQSAKAIHEAMGLVAPRQKKSARGRRIRSHEAMGVSQGKVNLTTFARFLGLVRQKYQSILTEAVKSEAKRYERTMPTGGNLELLSSQTLHAMSQWVEEELNDRKEFKAKPVSEQHVVIRAAQVLADSMKTQQETRLKAAQTQAIIARAAKAAYEQLPAAARTSVSQAQIVQAMAQALMGDDVGELLSPGRAA